MFALSEQVKISTALAYASGTADRTGAILDTADYDGVLIVVAFATIAAGCATTVKAQESDAPAMGDAADLLGTGIAVAADDDGQVFYLDVFKPQKRYLRVYVDKDASNASGETALYFQYGPKVEPIVNTVTDLVTGELHLSPIAGTA